MTEKWQSRTKKQEWKRKRVMEDQRIERKETIEDFNLDTATGTKSDYMNAQP